MADNWTSILQSKIHSAIKNSLYDRLVIKYPNIDFVTADKNMKDPTFPTVKTKLLPFVERGADLEGKTINAVLATVQIDVTTNKTEHEALSISYEVMSVLKSMMFEIIASPEVTKEGDVQRAVMRARRIIGSGDAF